MSNERFWHHLEKAESTLIRDQIIFGEYERLVVQDLHTINGFIEDIHLALDNSEITPQRLQHLLNLETDALRERNRLNSDLKMVRSIIAENNADVTMIEALLKARFT